MIIQSKLLETRLHCMWKIPFLLGASSMHSHAKQLWGPCVTHTRLLVCGMGGVRRRAQWHSIPRNGRSQTQGAMAQYTASRIYSFLLSCMETKGRRRKLKESTFMFNEPLDPVNQLIHNLVIKYDFKTRQFNSNSYVN